LGPSLLDRNNQFSFGFVFTVPWNIQFSVISHFDSPLPVSLVSANGGPSPGQIYATDFTGDGTVDDLIPGSKLGAFGHTVNAGNINSFINQYNSAWANNPTPAGQTLVNNGMFTVAQLQALGGVASSIPLAPTGQVGMGWLRAFDLKMSWLGKFSVHDHPFTLQPSVGFFNLFNFSNFDLPPNTLTGVLNGSGGSINGTTQATRVSDRVGIGTGVYGLGSPRAIEFGLT